MFILFGFAGQGKLIVTFIIYPSLFLFKSFLFLFISLAGLKLISQFLRYLPERIFEAEYFVNRDGFFWLLIFTYVLSIYFM